MRSIIVLSLVFFLSSLSYAEEGKSLFDNFFNLYFELSPNNQGLLEGKGVLDINWWSYLKSGFVYTSGHTAIITNVNISNYTLSSESKTYTLNILQTREYLAQDILKALFNAGEELDFLSLNGGIGYIMSFVDESLYGYAQKSNTVSFFLENKKIESVKPVLSGDLSLKMGPVSLGGYISYPLDFSQDTIVHEIVNSLNPAKISNIQKQNAFEAVYGGNLSFNFDQFGIISLLIDYHNYTSAFTRIDNGVGYAYNVTDLSSTISLELAFLKNILKLMDQVPVVGLTFIQHNSWLVSVARTEITFDDLRVKFNFGIKY